MIKLFTVFVTLTTATCFADAAFEEQKKRTLGFIEERAAVIATHKACVEKATTEESLRECNKAQRISAMKRRQNMTEEKNTK